jgi:hypothetical protein
LQTWAQAAANLSAGSGGPLHPAAVAAAWSKHLSQAQAAKVRRKKKIKILKKEPKLKLNFQEKDILGLNKALAVDLVASATRKPPLLPINVRIPDQRGSRFSQSIKSSPGPASDSPLQGLTA